MRALAAVADEPVPNPCAGIGNNSPRLRVFAFLRLCVHAFGRCCALLVNLFGLGSRHALAPAGHRFRVARLDLVNAVEQEKLQGKAGRIAPSLMRMDLVILRELGYLPFSQASSASLSHLLSKLYEHTSVLVITNLKFAEWSSVFGL